MAVGSVSSYSPMFNYQGWVNTANSRTEALKDQIGYDSTESTSSTSSTSSTDKTSGSSSSSSTDKTSGSYSNSSTATSASSFLLNYKQSLTELESASKKLQVGAKDNVFSKYESAVSALSKAGTEEEKKAAQAKVDKAQEDIISAITDFADKYNSTISFLESNSNRSAGVARQLESLKRSLPTEDAMKKALGMSLSTTGKLQVDKDELKKSLDRGYGLVKDVMGGQYGIAQRTGTKASTILDSSIDTVVGSSKTQSSSTSKDKNSSTAGVDFSDLSSDDSMSAYFTSFASFAKSGAYNLSNYYAVGMLLNTLV